MGIAVGSRTSFAAEQQLLGGIWNVGVGTDVCRHGQAAFAGMAIGWNDSPAPARLSTAPSGACSRFPWPPPA